MNQCFNWEDFWHVYKTVTGMEPKYRKDFEEEVEKEKRELIKLFGGTKVEVGAHVGLTADEKKEIITKYIEGIEKRAQKKEIPEEVTAKIQREVLYFLQMYISEKDLITGYITKNSAVTVPRKKGIVPGMKISKALRLYLKENSLEEYTDFLIQDLSVLQGQLKMLDTSAKVVISLEPLDFLLASDVTTGWKTCHSLDGHYPAGNLSYLFDAHTVIAYAYRTTEKKWGLELPKKMWRQWIYIDVDSALALFQRQYPAGMIGFEKTVCSIVGNALKKYHNTDKNWIKKNWDEEKEYDYFFNEAELAYSDKTETYIYFRGISPSDKDDWYMIVGEIPLCPVCGGELDMSSKLICSRCAGYIQCAQCSKWVPEDDIHYGADHYPYCEECYDKLFINCAYCGETVYKEDAKHTPDGEYICENCFDEHFTACTNCGKTLWKDEAEYVDSEPYCDECYLQNFTVCSNCGGVISKTEVFKDINGKDICEYCAESSYVTCEECGKLVNEEEAYYIEDNYFLCPHCYKKAHKKAAV